MRAIFGSKLLAVLGNRGAAAFLVAALTVEMLMGMVTACLVTEIRLLRGGAGS